MKRAIPLSEIPGGRPAIARALEGCRARIERAAARCGRDPGEIRLVAVTKYVDTDVVRAMWELGLRDFGENRVQELERKLATFAALDGARIHFIGHLQRNKVRKVVGTIHSLHALDSVRLLDAIAEHVASTDTAPPELWVEINVPGESQKTGASENVARAVLRRAGELSGLPPVRGLMTMAPYSDEPEDARPTFRRLRELRDRFVEEGLLSAEAGLSMGMSGDFEVAIEEGATTIRVGSLLYHGSDT